MPNIISITDAPYNASTSNSASSNNIAIQSALNQKGIIYIPDGIFNVSGNLNISSNTHIFGTGTLKLNASSGNGVPILNIINNIDANNVKISDIILDGSSISNTSDFGLINMSTSNGNINFNNIELKGLSIINAGYWGIKADHVSKLKIIGNKIVDFINTGINCIFSYDTIVEGNYIDGKINSPSKGIHGIQFWGNYNNQSSSARHIASNNIVKNVSGGGIWSAHANYITISGNIIENCDDVGIDIEGGLYATIIGNSVKDCINGGITTFYASKFITITGNTINQGNGFGSGIWIHGDGLSEKLVISSNVINTQNSYGIQTDQAVLQDSLINSNKIVSTMNPGIRLLEANQIRLVGNDIMVGNTNDSNSYNIGIVIEGGCDCIIESNNIKTLKDNSPNMPNSSDRGGIFLIWKSDPGYNCQRNIVRNNRIDGFTVSVNDNCWGDNTSRNYICENNLTSIYFRNANGTYGGLITGNRNNLNPNLIISPVAY